MTSLIEREVWIEKSVSLHAAGPPTQEGLHWVLAEKLGVPAGQIVSFDVRTATGRLQRALVFSNIVLDSFYEEKQQYEYFLGRVAGGADAGF